MRSVGPIIGASSSYQCGEKVIKSLAEASSLRRYSGDIKYDVVKLL